MYKIDKKQKEKIIELIVKKTGISKRMATKLFEALDSLAIKKLIKDLEPIAKQTAFYFSYNGEDQTTFCYVTPLSQKNSLLEEQTIIYLN